MHAFQQWRNDFEAQGIRVNGQIFTHHTDVKSIKPLLNQVLVCSCTRACVQACKNTCACARAHIAEQVKSSIGKERIVVVHASRDDTAVIAHTAWSLAMSKGWAWIGVDNVRGGERRKVCESNKRQCTTSSRRSHTCGTGEKKVDELKQALNGWLYVVLNLPHPMQDFESKVKLYNKQTFNFTSNKIHEYAPQLYDRQTHLPRNLVAALLCHLRPLAAPHHGAVSISSLCNDDTGPPATFMTDGRTDGRADGRTDGRADGRTDGRTGQWTGGWTGGRTCGWTCGWTGGWMDGRTDSLTDRSLVRSAIDGWMDGWMGRWTDGSADGWMDRWVGRWMGGWMDVWMGR